MSVLKHQITASMAKEIALKLGAELNDEEADIFADGYNAAILQVDKSASTELPNTADLSTNFPVIPDCRENCNHLLPIGELIQRLESQTGDRWERVVNDVSSDKPLTITLPDASSKAFWSGTGKGETFHPETYKRWVKEAIERACAIASIEVRVK